MSAATLVLFLGREADIDGWYRLEGGRVVARGSSIEGLTAPAGTDGTSARVAAVVPGEQVSLHWLEIPSGLSPAQASAAARLMAADLSAEPPELTHVAVGAAVEGSPARCVAIASSERMADWLRRCQEVGLEPHTILPEPLLLPALETGVARLEKDGIVLYRGCSQAFAAEPDLAALIIDGGAVQDIDAETLESRLAPAIAEPAVNLRQGPFARRKHWKTDWKLVRRLALIAALFLLATLAIQLASILRYTYAADEAEAEAMQAAAAVLPGDASPVNPQRQLEALLAERRGAETGFSALLSSLFSGLRAVPDVQLASITYDARGGLRATVLADNPGSIAALVQRLDAAGLAAEAGTLSARNGRQAAELTVRAQ